MLDLAISKALVSKKDTNDAAQKGGYYFLGKLIRDYLVRYNIPLSDPCCSTASAGIAPVQFNGTDMQYWNGSAWVNAPVPAAELAPLTPNAVVITDGSGDIEASATTATELSYVHGVTSAIQTQLSSKPTIVAVPATATSTGVAGQVAYDSTHFYVCVATNTWVRQTLATF